MSWYSVFQFCPKIYLKLTFCVCAKKIGGSVLSGSTFVCKAVASFQISEKGQPFAKMFILWLCSCMVFPMWQLKAFSNLTSLVLLTTHDLGLCMTEGLNNNTVPIFQGRTLKVKEVSFPSLTVADPGFEPRQSGSGCNHCVILPLMVRKVTPFWGGRRKIRQNGLVLKCWSSE